MHCKTYNSLKKSKVSVKKIVEKRNFLKQTYNYRKNQFKTLYIMITSVKNIAKNTSSSFANDSKWNDTFVSRVKQQLCDYVKGKL